MFLVGSLSAIIPPMMASIGRFRVIAENLPCENHEGVKQLIRLRHKTVDGVLTTFKMKERPDGALSRLRSGCQREAFDRRNLKYS